MYNQETFAQLGRCDTGVLAATSRLPPPSMSSAPYAYNLWTGRKPHSTLRPSEAITRTVSFASAVVGAAVHTPRLGRCPLREIGQSAVRA